MVASTSLLIDVASCHEMSFLEPESKEKVQQVDGDDETATTDVGSAISSDAESTTSTSSEATTTGHRSGRPARVRFCSTLETIPGTPVAGNHLELSSGICASLPTSPAKKKIPLIEEVSDCHEFSADESDVETARPSMEIFQQILGDQAPPLPPPRSPKRRSKCSSSAKLAVNAASMNSFSTIPVMCSSKRRSQQDFPTVTSDMCGPLGTTPVKTRRRSQKSCIQNQQANTLAVTSDAEGGLGKGIYGTNPAPLPQSPKKDAHDALLSNARWERIPVKVNLAWSLEAGVRKTLDPAMPAKKKPVFAEIAGAQAGVALSHFESGMPLKKRVSSFLLDEPPRTRRAPPGLVRMAR
mmetsp:Transcript_117366/g.203954  ORF Transcript_117366/g.203954 Transcript_117366/m.203954 type:complete len:353 (+) Transcript_117366:109-1167(+)